MYKTSLLSCTAAAAIILFNIQFTAHAATLEVSTGEEKPSNQTFEIIHAKTGGQIIGTNVTVIGNKNTNSSENKNVYAVTAEGVNSAITLQGSTTIKGTDSVISLGVEAKDDAKFQMTGGSITVSDIGALFWNNNNKESMLKDVTISSGENKAPLNFGVMLDKNGTVTLENVKVTQAINATVAYDHSTITISGGSFDAKDAAISAKNGSTVTLTNNAQITSSDDAGLAAKTQSTITMTKGTVTGKIAALIAEDGGHVKVTDVILKTKGAGTDEPAEGSGYTDGFGAFSKGSNSVIELENTTISDAKIGLTAQDGGAINMTGGTITASKVGALFESSNSDKNKLENITISSSKDGALLISGIDADKSTVTLKDVKVTQAQHAIIADHDSTIKISGGSFEAKGDTIQAISGSNIVLTDVKQITSSDSNGLAATSNSTIVMTDGTVTGKKTALAAADGGHIKVTDVALKTVGVDALTEGAGIIYGFGAFANGDNSVIELLGKTTISDGIIGLEAQDGGAISMAGGTITASKVGAVFFNSKSDKNKLENVTISNAKEEEPLLFGVKADEDSKVALKNIEFVQADSGISADNSSTITVSGGSFDAKKVTVHAENGSTITLTDNAQIASSGNVGLVGETQSTITMIGGSVTGREAALAAKTGGHITVTDVALKIKAIPDAQAQGSDIISGFGAFSEGADSVIELLGKTTISDSIIGLQVQKSGAVKMTGGTIKASMAGAVFSNTKSDKNKLENVTISSTKDGELLINGVDADNDSAVALKNVTVMQANSAIIADNSSTVTVSGGSFDAKHVTIGALKGGSVILTDNAQIISSEDSGLYAHDNGTISMTGGTIKASYNGAGFVSSESDKNKLENVTISSSKDNELLQYGIEADKNSTVTLKNVTVTQATSAIVADDHSTITVSGGSFDGELDGIYASNGSTVIIDNKTEITTSSGYGLHADGAQSKITMTGGTVSGWGTGTLFAENSGQIDVTGITITSTDGTGDGAHADGSGSIIELHNTTIKDVSTGLMAYEEATIKMTGGSITASIIGASFNNSKSAENKLENVKISSGKDDDQQLFGVVATHDSNLTLKNVTVTQENIGIASAFNSQINVSGGEFNVKDSGAYAQSDSTIIIKDNAQINASDGSGLHASGPQSQITMTDGTVFGKKAALYTENGGHIDVTNVSATAQIGGLQIMSLSYTDPDNPQKRKSSEINLVNTKLHVENGAGILIGAFTDNDIENNTNLAIGTANLKNSEIHADVLLGNGIYWKDKEFWNQVGLKSISNGTFTLSADQSILEGRANIAKDRNVHFDLKNNTKWTLKISKNEKDDDGNLLDIAQRSRSDISTLNLDNSSIIFNGPTEDHYQTLHIGSGKPDTQEVYNATGDANIYFNIAWSDGAAINDQKTDRLLIHG
ncbi:beta strand repeat-containing protein, partial [Bartonella sp. OD88NMGDW]|uniref:beta strand repeat-containing protein n=1 Tax=Bartonella sp. OD88NMGDW TaxID=3243571 RepID=UPI0035D0A61B